MGRLFVPVSVLLLLRVPLEPPVDRRIDAVEGQDPAVVVETDVAPERVPAVVLAAHPVAGSVGQGLAERLVVPAAERHIPAPVLPLALFTRVVTVTRVAHPQRVGRTHVVCVDDKPEVVAGALECGQGLRGQQQQDVDQEVVWQQRKVRHLRPRLQQLLHAPPHRQEVLRHRAVTPRSHGRTQAQGSHGFTTPLTIGVRPNVGGRPEQDRPDV